MNNAKTSKIGNCEVVTLSKVNNPSGNLTAINSNNLDIPFTIQRVYYLYDVPGGVERGGHGHKELEQFLIAASGSFDVELSDGKEKKKVSLNRPYEALHIVPGIWRELKNFSSGSICLVLASHKYEEADYIRDYQDYVKFKSI